MSESPITRPSLLVRIRDPRDGLAWSQFVDIYAPLVYGYARKCGLQDADAADITQEVLRSVSTAAKKLEYDPKRGSFRGWLFTVVRNRLRNFLASRAHKERGSGDTEQHLLLQEQPAPKEQWDQDYEQHLF